jgi:hypothetical protein
MSLPLQQAGTGGRDTFLFRSAAEFIAAAGTLDGGAGSDTLYFQFDAALSDAAFTGLRNLEAIHLAGTGAQSLTLDAQAAAAFGPVVTVYGVRATTLDIDAGGFGTGTALVAYAGAGEAHLRGGAANDSFAFKSAAGFLAAGRSVDGGAGSDTLTLEFNATLSDGAFHGLSHLEALQLAASGAQSVTLGAEAAAAFAGKLTLYANRAGSLDLDAGGFGAGSRLVVYGSAGADTLRGGAGQEILTGGAGADLFVIGKGGVDQIADFTHGTDRIDLSHTGLTSFADLLAHARQGASGAVIDLGGGDSLTLRGLGLGSLTAADFGFATPVPVAGYQMVGSAYADGGTFWLTPPAWFADGAVWSQATVDLSRSVQWNLHVFLGSDPGGADGLSFALQHEGPGVLGYAGGFVGVEGIATAFGFKIDTCPNFEVGDPADNFIRFFNHGQGYAQTGFDQAHTVRNLEDGAWHGLQVLWNANTKTLSYVLDGTVTGAKQYDVVAQDFGGDHQAWFGLTAGCGSLVNAQGVTFDSIYYV